MWIYNGEEFNSFETLFEEVIDSNEDFFIYVDEILDGCYPSYEICGQIFLPSQIIKNLDSSLYNLIVLDEKNEIISEWEHYMNCHSPDDGQSLYDFLGLDGSYADEMKDVIWYE